MDILEIVRLAKDIGFARIVRYLARLAWIVLPFCVWFLVVKLVGNSFFLLNFAFPGAVALVLIAVFLATQNYFLGTYDYTIMKSIENAGQMFASPDGAIARRYSEECDRILLPYLYTSPLVMAGLRSLPPTTTHGRLAYTIGLVFNVYCSYSVVALLSRNGDCLVEILRSASSEFGLTEVARPIMAWGTRYWMPIFAVVVILSLHYTHTLARGVSRQTKLALYSDSFLSILRSISVAFCMITDVPGILKDSKYAVRYKPFVDPLTVPAIIQRAVQNVEGSTCNVTFYSYKLSTIEECERLAKMFVADRRMPGLLRLVVSGTRIERKAGARVLETSNAVSPVLYLGTIENRCLFVGLVRYLPDQRVRVASFHFDNTYVRMEFVNIMKTERDKSRQLIEKLPASIESLVKRMEGR